MASVAIPMTVLTLTYVAVNVLVWAGLKDKQKTMGLRIAIGILYGILSILSTHFGVDYGNMMLNVRDLGPLSAGLFFDPVSGIIAGLIGGIERYIAGTYFGVASYTRIACSISTCLAGFLAAFLTIFIFKGRKPSLFYSLCIGSLIEVFHMYVVIITHRDDMIMACYIVEKCSVPMILFSGLGLAMTSLVIKLLCGEWYSPLEPVPEKELPVTHKFQVWLFLVTMLVFLMNFTISYSMQSQASLQSYEKIMYAASEEYTRLYGEVTANGDQSQLTHYNFTSEGHCFIIDSSGDWISDVGDSSYSEALPEIKAAIDSHNPGTFFTETIAGQKMYCKVDRLGDGADLIIMVPESEIYEARDREVYESLLSDILLFAVVYILISLLVEKIVVENLNRVNESLRKITGGDLDEEVNVYTSSEFASLSDDINITVETLKGYIKAAEQRIEQELLLAHSIQVSALPTNFDFHHQGFELYATMDPAREVGGDFYDYFFVDSDRVCLVIADVSGKGIPAALLMMKTKTTIRNLAETGKEPAEVMNRTNKELCVNNELGMFVTVWIGMINLTTGDMKCVDAGHEYPAVRRKDGDYMLLKRTHCPALGFMEEIEYTEYDLHLDSGDAIFVYTDGIPEGVNPELEQYGTWRMLYALNENKEGSERDILEAVKKDIDEFAGSADQFDDITMMGFRYKGTDA